MTRPRLIVLLALAVLLILGASWLVGRPDAADSASEDGTKRAAADEAPPSFSAPEAAGSVESAAPRTTPAVATVLVPADTSTVIAGRVAFTTGEAAPGVRVFAWLPAEAPTAAELALDPPPRSALSDDQGRFSITGLASGGVYTLGAVGRGVYAVQDAAAFKVAAGTLDAALSVGLVYGVRIVIRGENGEPTLTNLALRGRGPNCQKPKGSLDLLSLGRPLIELVGLSEKELTTRDPDAVILLCLAGAQPPEPIHIGGQVAGYESYHVQAPLGPLSEGLPDFVVRLRRLCDGFGRLTVECLGTGPMVAPRTGPKWRRDRVWVEMTPKGEEQRVMGFDLDLGSIPWRGASFDQIPIGRYSVRLWTDHRYLSVPREDQLARDFEIYAGDNLLSFDVGALGAVALELLRPDGSAWQRQVNLELSYEAWGKFSQNTSFGGPPYVIEALPVGRYRFHVTYPFAADSAGDADGYMLVDGSGIQDVTLRP